MWKLFKRKPLPEPGSVWESVHENPFERHSVVILGAAEGFVHYTLPMMKTWLFPVRYSCAVREFRSKYREEKTV